MTIYKNFLSRGYFPKELPPGFFSHHFAVYASSAVGRRALGAYKPQDQFTECSKYNLALPGLNDRQLRLPHPYSFARLAKLTSKNLRRLLQKAGGSPFARSRPVYEIGQRRAIRTLFKPANLARERATARGGSRFVLKVDISQYYPSLYTHAVGWAIDTKLRDRASWSNTRLVGKQLDQCLMDLQGKVSQGIPIGNDISFLLGEVVLGQIDKKLRVSANRGYRWFDDYEFGCDSREQAEHLLSELQRELERYRLRINPRKTLILELPQCASDTWHDALIDASKSAASSAHAMVRYFDTAFQLVAHHMDLPVLLYAIGALFRFERPKGSVLRVAESCITQAMLSEPGCAQKGFALLKYWQLNGALLTPGLLQHTVEQLITRHKRRGSSSDIAWSLTFCISEGIVAPKSVGRTLSDVEDDVNCILALHASSLGLLPGLSEGRIESRLAKASPDGPHWLSLYESVRQGYLPNLWPVVAANDLMSSMLAEEVAFYRPTLKPYSMVVHAGGAPNWIVQSWVHRLLQDPVALLQAFPGNALLALLGNDVGALPHEDANEVEVLLQLLGQSEPDQDAAPAAHESAATD